jgi:hypothetical protein
MRTKVIFNSASHTSFSIVYMSSIRLLYLAPMLSAHSHTISFSMREGLFTQSIYLSLLLMLNRRFWGLPQAMFYNIIASHPKSQRLGTQEKCIRSYHQVTHAYPSATSILHWSGMKRSCCNMLMLLHLGLLGGEQDWLTSMPKSQKMLSRVRFAPYINIYQFEMCGAKWMIPCISLWSRDSCSKSFF